MCGVDVVFVEVYKDVVVVGKFNFFVVFFNINNIGVRGF